MIPPFILYLLLLFIPSLEQALGKQERKAFGACLVRGFTENFEMPRHINDSKLAVKIILLFLIFILGFFDRFGHFFSFLVLNVRSIWMYNIYQFGLIVKSVYS